VLNVDHSRHVQMQQIKDGKSRTFAHKFNENNQHINQSNLKLLSKLENVKSFARYTSYAASDRPRELTPKPVPTPVKLKIIETEKENSRIFSRMRSVSSNLSKDRLLNDYAKAEKIKSRISKYALENNKVALKYDPSYPDLRNILHKIRATYQVVPSRATTQNASGVPPPSTRGKTSSETESLKPI
jgi:hypothetical protein